MKKIYLFETTVNKDRVDFHFTVDSELQKYFHARNHLFYRYNHGLEDIPLSILNVPFVANVIPLVWLSDATLVIDELDQNFYECIPLLKAAYQRMFPNYPFRGNLIVNNVRSNPYEPERETAAFFSGGLDALTTYIRIRDTKPLLITEYGWHEEEIRESEVWEADRDHVVDFAKREGLDNLLIESNYGNFVKAQRIDRDFQKRLGDNWWHGLHHGLAIITAAIPVAFKLRIRTLYIASSHTIGNTYSCASDPSTDNLIRFGSGGVFHDGYELTRQDKIKVVVDHYTALREQVMIRVCFKNKENCCDCEKCMRTLLGIVAEGCDPNDFGFPVPRELSGYLQRFLEREVKFFTNIKIDTFWNNLQKHMRRNSSLIPDKELLTWFLDYDFVSHRRRALFHYRVTQFFPIVRRKLRTRLQQLRENG